MSEINKLPFMSKNEFMRKIKEENLEKYCIGAHGKIIQAPNAIGYAFNKDKWVIYETDERGSANIIFEFKKEEYALAQLYKELVERKREEEIFKSIS